MGLVDSGANKTHFSFKINDVDDKGKKIVNPRFVLLDENFNSTDTNARAYEGTLQGVSIREWNGDNGPQYSLAFDCLGDDLSVERVEIVFTNTVLGLINRLSSAEELQGQRIKLTGYTTESDGKEYGEISLRINGEKVEWLLDPKALNKIRDKHSRWIDLFNKHVAPKFENKPAPEPQKEAEPEPIVDDFDDDLPF